MTRMQSLKARVEELKEMVQNCSCKDKGQGEKTSKGSASGKKRETVVRVG